MQGDVVRGLGMEDDSFANYRSSLRARRERLARREEMLSTQECKAVAGGVSAKDQLGSPAAASGGASLGGGGASAAAAASADAKDGSDSRPSMPASSSAAMNGHAGSHSPRAVAAAAASPPPAPPPIAPPRRREQPDVAYEDDDLGPSSPPLGRGLGGESAALASLRRSLPVRMRSREGPQWPPPAQQLDLGPRNPTAEAYATAAVSGASRAAYYGTSMATSAGSSTGAESTVMLPLTGAPLADRLEQLSARMQATAIPEGRGLSLHAATAASPPTEEETREERIARYKEERRRALAARTAEQLAAGSSQVGEALPARTLRQGHWPVGKTVSDGVEKYQQGARSRPEAAYNSDGEQQSVPEPPGVTARPSDAAHRDRSPSSRAAAAAFALGGAAFLHANDVPLARERPPQQLQQPQQQEQQQERRRSRLQLEEEGEEPPVVQASRGLVQPPAASVPASSSSASQSGARPEGVALAEAVLAAPHPIVSPKPHQTADLGRVNHRSGEASCQPPLPVGHLGLPANEALLALPRLPAVRHEWQQLSSDSEAVAAPVVRREDAPVEKLVAATGLLSEFEETNGEPITSFTNEAANVGVGSKASQSQISFTSQSASLKGAKDIRPSPALKDGSRGAAAMREGQAPAFIDILKRFEPSETLLAALSVPASINPQKAKTIKVNSASPINPTDRSPDQGNRETSRLPATEQSVSGTAMADASAAVAAIRGTAFVAASGVEPERAVYAAAIAAGAATSPWIATAIRGESQQSRDPEATAVPLASLPFSASESQKLSDSERSSLLTDDDRQSEQSSLGSTLCVQSTATSSSNAAAAAAAAVVPSAVIFTAAKAPATAANAAAEQDAAVTASLSVEARPTAVDIATPCQLAAAPSRPLSGLSEWQHPSAAAVEMAQTEPGVAQASACEASPKVQLRSAAAQARQSKAHAAATAKDDSLLDPQLAYLLQARLKRVSDAEQLQLPPPEAIDGLAATQSLEAALGGLTSSSEVGRQPFEGPIVARAEVTVVAAPAAAALPSEADRSSCSVADKVSYFLREQLRQSGRGDQQQPPREAADSRATGSLGQPADEAARGAGIASPGTAAMASATAHAGSAGRATAAACIRRRDRPCKRERSQTQPVTCNEVLAAQCLGGDATGGGAGANQATTVNDGICKVASIDVVGAGGLDAVTVNSLAVMTLDEKIRLFIERSVVMTTMTSSARESPQPAISEAAPAGGSTFARQKPGRPGLTHKMRQQRCLTLPFTSSDVREALSLRGLQLSLPASAAAAAAVGATTSLGIRSPDPAGTLRSGAASLAAAMPPAESPAAAVELACLVAADDAAASALFASIPNAQPHVQADAAASATTSGAERHASGGRAESTRSGKGITKPRDMNSGGGGHDGAYSNHREPVAASRAPRRDKVAVPLLHASDVTDTHAHPRDVGSHRMQPSAVSLAGSSAQPKLEQSSKVKPHATHSAVTKQAPRTSSAASALEAASHVTPDRADKEKPAVTTRAIGKLSSSPHRDASDLPSVGGDRRKDERGSNRVADIDDDANNDNMPSLDRTRRPARMPRDSRDGAHLGDGPLAANGSMVVPDVPSYMRATHSHLYYREAAAKNGVATAEPAMSADSAAATASAATSANQQCGGRSEPALSHHDSTKKPSARPSASAAVRDDGDELPSYMRATSSFAHKVEHLFAEPSSDEDRSDDDDARSDRRVAPSGRGERGTGSGGGTAPERPVPVRRQSSTASRGLQQQQQRNEPMHSRTSAAAPRASSRAAAASGDDPSELGEIKIERSRSVCADSEGVPSYMRATASYVSRVEPKSEINEATTAEVGSGATHGDGCSGARATAAVVAAATKEKRSSRAGQAAAAAAELRALSPALPVASPGPAASVAMAASRSGATPSFMRPTASYVQHAAAPKGAHDRASEAVAVRSPPGEPAGLAAGPSIARAHSMRETGATAAVGAKHVAGGRATAAVRRRSSAASAASGASAAEHVSGHLSKALPEQQTAAGSSVGAVWEAPAAELPELPGLVATAAEPTSPEQSLKSCHDESEAAAAAASAAFILGGQAKPVLQPDVTAAATSAVSSRPEATTEFEVQTEAAAAAACAVSHSTAEGEERSAAAVASSRQPTLGALCIDTGSGSVTSSGILSPAAAGTATSAGSPCLQPSPTPSAASTVDMGAKLRKRSSLGSSDGAGVQPSFMRSTSSSARKDRHLQEVSEQQLLLAAGAASSSCRGKEDGSSGSHRAAACGMHASAKQRPTGAKKQKSVKAPSQHRVRGCGGGGSNESLDSTASSTKLEGRRLSASTSAATAAATEQLPAPPTAYKRQASSSSSGTTADRFDPREAVCSGSGMAGDSRHVVLEARQLGAKESTTTAAKLNGLDGSSDETIAAPIESPQDLGCKLSVPERLALLQKSGSEEWKKRLSKAGDLDEAPVASAGSGGRSGGGGTASIADRLSKMQEHSQRWQQKKGIENDAVQFTAEAKLASSSASEEATEEATAGGRQVHVSSPLIALKQKAVKRASSLKLKSAAGTENGIASGSIVRPKSMLLGHPPASSTKAGHVAKEVKVPSMEDLSAFFAPASLTDDSDHLTDVDLSRIIAAPNVLSSVVRIKPKRKNHGVAKNPVKALLNRDDLRTAYTEVITTGPTAELHPASLVKSVSLRSHHLAKEALAGLASKENFKKVALKKMNIHEAGSLLGGKEMLPYKEIMLLQIKGRRHVQTRLVEPHAASVNSGDCFLLVLKDSIYVWYGEFANVVEKSKASELATFIQATKDLGCKSAQHVIEIDERKSQSLMSIKQFWNHLGGRKNYAKAGSSEEDELYEEYITQTNLVYVVRDEELVPLEQYCGTLPKFEMLNEREMLVFDFGTELYVWYGREVPLDRRAVALELARQLFDQGYDYAECNINPMSPLLAHDKGGMPLKSKQRPKWCLLAKVNQNMETALFKEKFHDWPPEPVRAATIAANSTTGDKEKDSAHSGGKASSSSNIAAAVAAAATSAAEELRPCDVGPMLEPTGGRSPVTLLLENTNVGRGSYWCEFEDGLKREYRIETTDVRVWHVLDYEHREVTSPSSFGQFFSAETYIVRWQYVVQQLGVRDLRGNTSKHQLATLGRERHAYFFWRGEDASVNQKGALALTTVELDKGAGPQIPVEQGQEPACFMRLFNGKMAVHRGKRPGSGGPQPGQRLPSQLTEAPAAEATAASEKAGHVAAEMLKLYVVRHDVESEACMLEVAPEPASLRSRGCFVLISPSGCGHRRVHVWLGSRASKASKHCALGVARHVAASRPSEFGFAESDDAATGPAEPEECTQGRDDEEFVKLLLAQPAASHDSQAASPQPLRPPGHEEAATTLKRLFHMSSASGKFVAQELLSAARPNPADFREDGGRGTSATCTNGGSSKHLADAGTPPSATVQPFPFVQSQLYGAQLHQQQPALFLADAGSSIYLWQGWWPAGDEEPESDGGSSSARTESALMRFAVERRLAAHTVLSYARERRTRDESSFGAGSSALLVYAGHEPASFVQLFPSWTTCPAALHSNAQDNRTEVENIDDVVSCWTKCQYSFADLKSRPLPDGVDSQKLEAYLSDIEFQEVMKMSRDEYTNLPYWKQINLKKEVGLF